MRPLITYEFTFEGKISKEHLVHHDSNCPDINLIRIDSLSKYFRSHVGGSSTEGGHIIIVFSAKSQITNLCHISIGLFLFCICQHQYIFGLDIPVQEIFSMHMLKSIKHTLYDIQAFVKLKNSVFSSGLSRM